MVADTAHLLVGDGDVFVRVAASLSRLKASSRNVDRAHVEIRFPRAAWMTSIWGQVEQTGAGTIRFRNQSLLGPPPSLLGRRLSMRLDDGRMLDFVLCDSGNIVDVRFISSQRLAMWFTR